MIRRCKTDDLTITSMDVSWLSLLLINLEGAKSSTRYPFTRHYHNSVIISRRCRPNDAKVQRLSTEFKSICAQSSARSRFLLFMIRIIIAVARRRTVNIQLQISSTCWLYIRYVYMLGFWFSFHETSNKVLRFLLRRQRSLFAEKFYATL